MVVLIHPDSDAAADNNVFPDHKPRLIRCQQNRNRSHLLRAAQTPRRSAHRPIATGDHVGQHRADSVPLAFQIHRYPARPVCCGRLQRIAPSP